MIQYIKSLLIRKFERFYLYFEKKNHNDMYFISYNKKIIIYLVVRYFY